MSSGDGLGDLFERLKNGDAREDEVHAAYDQVADAVPNGALADGLSHAFKSDQTPPFEQMVSSLFDKSTPDQKADFVNHLLSAPEAAVMGVGPQVAERISPAAVQMLAQEAAVKDPSIIDRVASFYARHPKLVKSIGAVALALLIRRISTSWR